jgi:hypothetical protein
MLRLDDVFDNVHRLIHEPTLLLRSCVQRSCSLAAIQGPKSKRMNQRTLLTALRPRPTRPLLVAEPRIARVAEVAYGVSICDSISQHEHTSMVGDAGRQEHLTRERNVEGRIKDESERREEIHGSEGTGDTHIHPSSGHPSHALG